MAISKRAGAAGLATIMAAGALSMVVNTGVAEARCQGVNGETTSDYWVNGTRRVAEAPNSGTCDDQGDYYFTLHDTSSDGHYAELQKDGDGNGSYASVGHAGGIYPNPNGLVYFDSTHRAYERLCIENVNTGADNCGFGRTHGGRGLSVGF